MSDQQREQAPKKRAAKGREAAAPETKVETASDVAAASEGAVPAPDADPIAPAAELDAGTPDAAASAAAIALARTIEAARAPAEAPAAEAAPQAPSEPIAIKAPPAVAVPPSAAAPAPTWRRHGLQAAAVVLALGAGWVAGAHLSSPIAPEAAAVPAWAEAANASLRDSRDDVVRLSGDVRALKVTLDALKEGLDRPRPDAGTRQVMERLERSERVAQEGSARLVKVAEQLERLEREPAKAAATVTERLDRIERQVVATANTVATGTPAAAPAKVSAPVPDPTQTASLAKPDPRQTRVEGWVLLEVYDGAALVEGPNKVHEIGPGQALPGLGKVHAIEKRGKAWIVVTEKGYIGTETR